MSTVNQGIVDDFNRHALDLNRYEAGVKRRVLSQLKKLENELVSDLRGASLTGFQKAKLNALLKQTRESIATAYGKMEKVSSVELAKLASLEARFATRSINAQFGAEVTTVAVSPEKMQAIVGKTMFEGAQTKEWWSRASQRFQQKFGDVVRSGLLKGETTDKIVQRLRSEASLPASRGLTALTRTSVHAVANEARLTAYLDNQDVVKAVQQRSTLDGRTSDICIAYSGLVWELPDFKPVGHNKPFGDGLPRHWNCRSALVPVTKSLAEMAKTDDPDPEAVKARLAKLLKKEGFSRGQISRVLEASAHGDVPRDMDYEVWLKTRPEEEQLEILGPSKFDLWSRGKINLRDLVASDGEAMTVAQLRRQAVVKPLEAEFSTVHSVSQVLKVAGLADVTLPADVARAVRSVLHALPGNVNSLRRVIVKSLQTFAKSKATDVAVGLFIANVAGPVAARLIYRSELLHAGLAEATKSLIYTSSARMVEAGFDLNLLHNAPLAKVRTQREIFTNRGIRGFYQPDANIIALAANADAGTMIHEVGHKVDFTWFGTKVKGRLFNTHTARGAANYWDFEKAIAARKELTQEMHELRRRANSLLGREKFNWEKDWHLVRNTVLPIPSPYSLSADVEYFAETFRLYHSNFRSRQYLKMVAPKAYDFYKTMNSGAFYRTNVVPRTPEIKVVEELRALKVRVGERRVVRSGAGRRVTGPSFWDDDTLDTKMGHSKFGGKVPGIQPQFASEEDKRLVIRQLEGMLERASREDPMEPLGSLAFQRKELMRLKLLKHEAEAMRIAMWKLSTVPGFDPRLLEEGGVKLLMYIKEVDDLIQKYNPSVAAAYTPGARQLLLLNHQDRIPVIELASIYNHELGHHFFFRWLFPDFSNQNLAHPRLNSTMTVLAKNAISEEFETARNKANLTAPIIQLRGFDLDGADFLDLVGAPSSYALTHPVEWFAESWRFYVMGGPRREMLRRRAPATYQVIEDLITGKMFKQGDRPVATPGSVRFIENIQAAWPMKKKSDIIGAMKTVPKPVTEEVAKKRLVLDSSGHAILYHVTYEDLVPTILKQGLRPPTPGESVFLTSRAQAEVLLRQFRDNGAKPALLEVRVKPKVLTLDDNMPAGDSFKTEFISPQMIKKAVEPLIEKKNAEAFVDELRRATGVKVKIVGGVKRKGFSGNDLDLHVELHESTAQQDLENIFRHLKSKGLKTVDKVPNLKEAWEIAITGPMARGVGSSSNPQIYVVFNGLFGKFRLDLFITLKGKGLRRLLEEAEDDII